MRRNFKGFFLFLLIVLLLPLASLANVQDSSDDLMANPHLKGGKDKCFICHTQKPPQLIDDHVETCTKCHIGNIENHPVTRHPIDVAVKIQIPTPLPLAAGERLVCSTCHDPHDDYGFSKMLRVQYHMLCVQCHYDY